MNELVRLVEGERREHAAYAAGSLVICFSGVMASLWLWSALGLILGGFGVVLCGIALKNRHRLQQLLDERSQIDHVERVKWLGRPALRITLVGGHAVTLPTWNVDREHVYELLQQRELPTARLLR